MKRVLSWFVLVICSYLSLFIINAVENLALMLAQYINDLNSFLFWAIILLGGSFGIGIAFTIARLLAVLNVFLSQRIMKSKNGVRYIVIGLTYVVMYACGLIMALLGVSLGKGSPLSQIIFCVSAIVFGAIIAICGKAKAEEEDPPEVSRTIAVESSVETDNKQKIDEFENNFSNSTFEEIRKWKKLLDDEIITQEEFEKKKREILNI